MTNELTVKMTYHARVERVERIEAIAEMIGFSRPVLTYIDKKEQKKYLLTSTGVILVFGISSEALITAFLATHEQARKLYWLAGKSQISPKVEKKIIKNCKKYSYLFEL